MDPSISRFLKSHHVLTLATAGEEGTWCAHVFYAWIPELNALVFTSDPETRHGREMLANPKVSGGIVLETKIVGKIRGLQLTGTSHPLFTPPTHQPETNTQEPATSNQEPATFRSAYLRHFPYAIATTLHLWVLHIETAKLTDNRLGFGKKTLWKVNSD